MYLCLQIEFMQSNSEQIGTLPGDHNQPGGPANTNEGETWQENGNQKQLKEPEKSQWLTLLKPIQKLLPMIL